MTISHQNKNNKCTYIALSEDTALKETANRPSSWDMAPGNCGDSGEPTESQI